MTRRQEKVSSNLSQLAAEYIGSHSNRTSLITVTNCTISPDGRNATVYVTVYPDNKQEEALAFLRRERTHMRDYIGKRMQSKILPFIDIELDVVEKARQIDNTA